LLSRCHKHTHLVVDLDSEGEEADTEVKVSPEVTEEDESITEPDVEQEGSEVEDVAAPTVVESTPPAMTKKVIKSLNDLPLVNDLFLYRCIQL